MMPKLELMLRAASCDNVGGMVAMIDDAGGNDIMIDDAGVVDRLW